jgi:hypothetical protein
MRKRLPALVVLAFGTLLYAQDNPLLARWKLNPAQSVLDGPMPAFVRDGIIQARPSQTPKLPYDKNAPIRLISYSGKEKVIFEMTVSADGRTLLVTQVDSGSEKIFNQHHTALLFERQ